MIAWNPVSVRKAIGEKIKEIVFFFDLSKRNDVTCKQKDFALGLYLIGFEVFFVDWEFEV